MPSPEFCRSCQDKGSENCNLPSTVAVIIAGIKHAGSILGSGYVSIGGAETGYPYSPDELDADFLTPARERASGIYIAAEICVVAHQVGTEVE